VLFADISGFTALAETMDPEDVRQVMNACFARLVPVVELYGGTIDKFIGDEIMALFGAPIAYENDAERAVRTALVMMEALTTFNAEQGTALGLHCGINTGLVIAGGIGTQSRQDYSVMGDAVNLAARLEDASERGQIFVGPETYHLTRTLFRYEPLAPMVVKGKADPVQVYQVRGMCEFPDRRVPAALTPLPLVGRTAELALLLDRWQHATQGLGQVVVLSGEAGIGKSRLVAALEEHVRQEDVQRLTLRCSPYHTNSVLYPLLAYLERALDWRQADTPEEKLRKLEEASRRHPLPLTEVVPLFAALLSLPLPTSYPRLTLTPQRQKQQTLEALLIWLLMLTEQQPVLLVVEDLHWIDPSTLDLLTLLVEQGPTARLLTLLTCRPEFQVPWGRATHLTPLALQRLSQPQVEAMITQVTGGKALPPELLQHLITKTDGVPLFVEELTKTVLESGLLREDQGQYVLTGPLQPLAVPTTLHDSLMARLDHLATVKGLAQLGATLGREFAYELLQAVSPWDGETLRWGLQQLVEAELLYQHGLPPQATYRFKHALIQDTAYQSLLRSTRQQYHQRIAQILEARFPELCETQPELLAQHYTEAGVLAQAIPYWQRAGDHANARSAYVEAIHHLTRGLELLTTLPHTPERDRQELRLRLALGVSLTVTRGWGAPEVAHTHARTRELCQQEEHAQLFPVLWGMWAFHLLRAEFQTARELATQLLTLAQRGHAAALHVGGHAALGMTLFMRGELAPSRAHLEQAIALYDPHQHRTLALHYSLDPKVGCLAFGAVALWMLGYPEQAVQRSQEAVTLAHELAHPFCLAFAQCWAAAQQQLLRESHAAQGQAEATMTLSAAHGFQNYLTAGMVLRGWALATQGQRAEGLAQMHQGLQDWRSTGAEQAVAWYLGLLAEGYGTVGQVEAGLCQLAEALALVANNGEGFYAPELHRLRGEFLLQQAASHAPQAEACFRQALDIGRCQQAKSWELRAAVSLARLWQHQGKRVEARELLAPVYGWFTEGFDTADLREAEALLKTLM
jgi:class 3 adenylate cyclase/predicted ATPase